MIRRYLSKTAHPLRRDTRGVRAIWALMRDCTIFELPETASLFDGDDVIERAEEMAAGAFGASMTLFSAGGCPLHPDHATLGAGGGRVVFARNAHEAQYTPPCWVSSLSGRGRQARTGRLS